LPLRTPVPAAAAKTQECECSAPIAQRYRAKLSGALADRIDMTLAVRRPSAEALAGEAGESSAPVRERVLAARRRQWDRLGPGGCNGWMTSAEVRRHCRLDAGGNELMSESHRSLQLSGRGWSRVLKVARTIADLAGRDHIGAEDIGEAVGMRRVAPSLAGAR